MHRRRFLTAALGLAAGSLAPGRMLPEHGTAGVPAELWHGADLAFGTTISLQVRHYDRQVAERAIRDALAAARNIDRLMTLHRADSQLAILNRTGMLADPDPHLRHVIDQAQRLSIMTGGAFDITVQPLWQAYSEAAQVGGLPDPAKLAAAIQLVDWRAVSSDENGIRLARPGMAVTLNGIAQGHAVDVAKAALAAHGIEHALLDIGELGARGRREAGQPWQVGIRDPRAADDFVARIAMDGRCVATSGDYATTFSADYRHHHIFDPQRGDSPSELASVTVIAPNGLLADGLSTALMVLGAEKALALVAEMQDVEVLMIDKAGRRWQSGSSSFS